MNRLSFDKRRQILHLLVEGSSIHSISRVVGVSRNTIQKLMLDAGAVAYAYHDYRVRDVPADRVEADELWSFCYAKQGNVSDAVAAPPEAGSVWTWTAIDPDSKLLIAWHVGDRSQTSANEFMADLASRLDGRIQLTTDQLAVYEEAVAGAFLGDVDYAQLDKQFTPTSSDEPMAITKVPKTGAPSEEKISTSIVERMNLSIRMGQRRYTRLTNAFSKRLYCHCASLALYFLHYNFCRPHSSLANPYLRTPAMAAGLVSNIRDLGWLVEMVDSAVPKPKRPGRYRKRP